MKKLTKILTGLTLSLALCACGSSGDKLSNTATGNSTKAATPEKEASIKESEKSSKVTYSTKAIYLPITEDMEMLSYMPPSEMLPQSNITYTVKSINSKDFLTKYEVLLHTNGWKTTLDKKPESIMVEKGEHQAAIIPQQVNKDLNILIMTK